MGQKDTNVPAIASANITPSNVAMRFRQHLVECTYCKPENSQLDHPIKGTRNLFGPHFMQMKMWYFYAVGKFVISWRCTLGSIYNALAPKIREFQKKIEY